MKKPIILSEIGFLRFLRMKGYFPEILQAGLLLVFLAIIIYGWDRYAPAEIESKLFAKSNIVNLAVWGIWWPTMILATVLLGRVWCSVCPLEFAGRIGEWIGHRAGISPRSATSWMRAGWLVLLLFGVVQLLIFEFELHRVPMYTAIYLLVMLLLALTTGLFLRDRAYCRAFCPVSILLKVYGRGGMLAVRPAVTGWNADRNIDRACRSRLGPTQLDTSRGEDCLLCLDCVQIEPRAGRMQLQARRPWTTAERRIAPASWPVTLFIMMLSGFVVFEIAGLHPQAVAAFSWLPTRLGEIAGIEPDSGLLKGIWTIIVFPLLLWSLVGLVAKIFFRNRRLPEILRSMAYPFSLVIIALHATKAIEKLAGWSGFLPYVLRDPSGESTARAIAGGTFTAPSALLPTPLILVMGVGLILGASFILWKEKASRGGGRRIRR